MKKAVRKNLAGATLIEAVVALTIFSFLITSATGIFKLTIDAQRNALAAKNIQESLRFALETMSKEIRGAQKNPGPGNVCGVGAGEIFRGTGGNDKLQFKNADGECVIYQYNTGQKNIGINRSSIGSSLPITPNDIAISDIKFLLDNYVPDSQQAKVTIRITAKAVNVPIMHQNNFTVETTISSRYYE